jgi:hypothetical protein
VKREGFEREKHIYTRNLERLKGGKIELKRKGEERRGKRRSLGKFQLVDFQNTFCNQVRCLEPFYINLNKS